MNKQSLISLDQIAELDPEKTVIWVTSSLKQRVSEMFKHETLSQLEHLPDRVKTLVVIGGGTMIDEAKSWKHYHRRSLDLGAIPSIWGSGAEVSPIVILSRNNKKVIKKDDALIPNFRSLWADLANSIPIDLARNGIGDCWAHALEGFLSPIATSELRNELSELIAELLTIQDIRSPKWFELSARACSAQSKSSVGLVHGIAHTIEYELKTLQPENRWGHAKICKNFLFPVMQFNFSNSDKAANLFKYFDLDINKISSTLKWIHNKDEYGAALPVLEKNWSQVITDPCSRTNSVLVRPTSLTALLIKV